MAPSKKHNAASRPLQSDLQDVLTDMEQHMNNIEKLISGCKTIEQEIARTVSKWPSFDTLRIVRLLCGILQHHCAQPGLLAQVCFELA
jgi:hypothetical protein